MCCIFFTLGQHDYHLILASNRDEYLHRPASHAAFHSFPPLDSFRSYSTVAAPLSSSELSSSPSTAHPILSGIDVDPSGGGTWLGIHALTGRWAALTNFTETTPPALPLVGKPTITSYRSRGELVKQWLMDGHGNGSLEAYVEKVRRERDEYAGCNLLVGQLPIAGQTAQLAYITNRQHSQSNREGSQTVSHNDDTSDPLPGEVRFLLHPRNELDQSGIQMGQTSCADCQQSTTFRTSLADTVDPSQISPAADPSSASTPSASPSSASHSLSHGLSNSVLSEPWSKVKTGRAEFDRGVARYASSSSTSRTDSNLVPSSVEGRRPSQEAEAEEEKVRQEALIEHLFHLLATPSVDRVEARADLRRTVLVPAFQTSPPPSKSEAKAKANRDSELANMTQSEQTSFLDEVRDKQEEAESNEDDDDEKSKVWYGTRTSTVLLVRRSGEVTFVERDLHTLHQPQESDQRLRLGEAEANAKAKTKGTAVARLLSEEERRQSQRRYTFRLGGASGPQVVREGDGSDQTPST